MATPGVKDDLAELKCFVLESMRETLVNNVDPTKFLPFLRSKFVLSGRESDTIKSCCSKSVYDGADKLIDVLCTKGAKGYDVFCDAIIHDKTQVFLLTALNRRLEMVKHIKKEQEMARAEQVRQRIILEQKRLQELSEVRSYQSPGKGATTCLNYAPRAHYMASRSPGSSDQPPQHPDVIPQHPGNLIPQHPGNLIPHYPGNIAPQYLGNVATQYPGNIATQYPGNIAPDSLVSQHPENITQQHPGNVASQHSSNIALQHPSNLKYMGYSNASEVYNSSGMEPDNPCGMEPGMEPDNPCGQPPSN